MQQIRGELSPTASDTTTLMDATFVLPDGRQKRVAIVQRPAAVAVAALTKRQDGEVEVLLVRQPRPAVGEEALAEIVAGKIDGDDDPLTTAQRELAEEAGLKASNWHPLGGETGTPEKAYLFPAPGFLREPIYLFVAYGLSEVPRREEDRHILSDWVLLADAVQMVLDGRIRDMKAMIAVLLVVNQQQLPIV
jgi:8-oxo-dGTP pyrophosphatase MutT (NUDIX family)